jgi:hypothetical protein
VAAPPTPITQPPALLPKFILAIAAVALIALFSGEIADFDFWWTLKSGQYIAQTHHLPTPDPFAFTTPMAHDAYAGESMVRHFNLTFEWLAQLIFYGTYSLAGFGGIVLLRALLLSGACAAVGFIAWKRSGGLYYGIGASFAASAVMVILAYDRSYLFTFFFLALSLAVLEARKAIWILPAIALIWANCHGGFFLQWIAIGAYCAESLWLRYRKQPQTGERTLWIVLAASIAAAGLNPNGYRVFEVLEYFRHSFLQSKLLEWQSPVLWPPTAFSALLFAGAAALLWARGRARAVDWLLFGAFAVAAVTAQRNVFLIAFWAPVVIASYVPWKRALPPIAHYAGAAAACGILALGIWRGGFQFRVAEWRFPSGAADFLLAHHVSGPMYNTYELGGYLIWRLWPQEKVFIDGRALSESVFNDYARILYNHSNADGLPTAQELLDRYNIQTIVMNGFEYSEGLAYNLALSLSSGQDKWKLVYNDPESVIFMRNPPEGVAPLPTIAVFDHFEAECALHIDHDRNLTLCARAMGKIFTRIQDYSRARKWLGYYLSMPHPADPEAEQAFQQLTSQ